jgi:hypothetical protein
MNSHEDAKDFRPEIIENYRDFEPPPQLRRIIDNLIDCVPPNYLMGLKTIILTNQAALTRDQRRQKIWSRKRKYRLAEARGTYHRATHSRPATVWLYVDNILKGTPAWTLRLPLVRYVEFGEVLHHEIGHHIHAVHKPIHDGPENVADAWSRKLSINFFRKHYWYIVPVKYPLLLLIKLALWIAQRLRSVTRRRPTDSVS